MSLQITSLNSGSNGNCYYIGNSTDAVLIDVGISCRETEKRMRKLGLSMSTVKAIFVSHEHGDHIKGVSTLANKYNLPVYITALTAKYGPRLINHLSKPFTANLPIAIFSLTITPFCKKHDAADPHSFTVKFNDITVGIITDIGIVCKDVIQHFSQCNAVFLESNYDEEMLHNGRYPQHLKNRITGGEGHISNLQALELFTKYKSPQLSHLLLSHLSKENNNPQLVKQLFNKHANGTEIIIASRYEATNVFAISPIQAKPSYQTSKIPLQMELFK